MLSNEEHSRCMPASQTGVLRLYADARRGITEHGRFLVCCCRKDLLQVAGVAARSVADADARHDFSRTTAAAFVRRWAMQLLQCRHAAGPHCSKTLRYQGCDCCWSTCRLQDATLMVPPGGTKRRRLEPPAQQQHAAPADAAQLAPGGGEGSGGAAPEPPAAAAADEPAPAKGDAAQPAGGEPSAVAVATAAATAAADAPQAGADDQKRGAGAAGAAADADKTDGGAAVADRPAAPVADSPAAGPPAAAGPYSGAEPAAEAAAQQAAAAPGGTAGAAAVSVQQQGDGQRPLATPRPTGGQLTAKTLAGVKCFLCQQGTVGSPLLYGLQLETLIESLTDVLYRHDRQRMPQLSRLLCIHVQTRGERTATWGRSCKRWRTYLARACCRGCLSRTPPASCCSGAIAGIAL